MSKQKKMTQARFWEVLEEVGKSKSYKKIIDDDECIRVTDRKDNEYCPVTAVCHKATQSLYPDVHFEEAAEAMGLSVPFARNVAYAADYNEHYASGDKPDLHAMLRSKLITSLGIKVKKAKSGAATGV